LKKNKNTFMRKILPFLLLFFCGFLQAQNYTFLKLNQPYVELVNPLSINNGEIWDDFDFSIAIPFTFNVNGQNFQELVMSDSFITFDGTLSEIISPMGNDLVDRGSDGENSLSPLSYKVEGPNGNRILKLQWKNCGSFDDSSLAMFVNFQIWLYETTNVFELHYGESSVTDPETFYFGEVGGIIGITTIDFDTNEFSNSLFLVGGTANPTTTNELDFITGTPTNTTVYRFTPTALSLGSTTNKSFVVYPNPSSDVFFVNGLTDNQAYTISDSFGKLIQKGTILLEDASINLSTYETGLYFLNFDSGNTIKILKK
jgi:hypothetical protein